MFTTRVPHRRALCVLLSALLCTGAPLAARAQEGDAAAYQAVVTGDDLNVRSGAGDTYYPFGKIHKGDVVTVMGERFGWARIRTEGHAFRNFYAYVKADEVRLSADGAGGITLGTVEVIAPNLLREGSPDSSWKWLVRLEPETRVRVLGTVTGDQGAFLKIAMPESASGWISTSYLKKATAEDLAAWKERVARETAPPTVPAGPANPANPPAGGTTTGTPPTGGASSQPNPAGSGTPRDAEPTAVKPNQDSITLTIPAGGSATQTPTTSNTPPAAGPATEKPAEARPAAPPATDTNAGGNDVSTPPVANDPLSRPEEAAKASAEPASPQPPSKTLAQITFDDVEAAYEAMKKAPIRDAEIEPLRQRYLAIIESSEAPDRHKAIAKARVELLDARLEIQQQILNLDRVRARAQMTSEDAKAARMAFDLAADYTAVGRVAASLIYDGSRLPRLLRLTDPASGRTIAYLQPDGRFDYVGMIDQLVGVVGDKSYDGGLRLMVIQPRRIDLLTTVER